MKITDDVLVQKLSLDIANAESFYLSKIQPMVVMYYQMYEADPEFYKVLFKKLSKTSEMTSTDIRDTIEWALPAMMKIFFSNPDLVSLQGENVEDDANAKTMQELINYQLLRRNKAFIVFYQWFKDAFITNAGIVKCYWQRESKITKQAIALSPDAYESFAAQSDVKILNLMSDYMTGQLNIEFEGPRLVKNQPVIENILASEFRFSGDATSLDECPFVAHKKKATFDYLRKQAKEGRFDKKKVETAIDQAGAATYEVLDQQNIPQVNQTQRYIDKGRTKTDLWECYVDITMDDDPEKGLLEPWIVWMCNKVILKKEKNTMGRHPFFMACPSIDPHKIWPEGGGFADSLAQIQHVKTAMLKQVMHSMALANNPQLGIVTDNLVDINDVIAGKSVIRLKTGSVRDAITNIPSHQLAPVTLSLMQYFDSMVADRTGISDYTKGQDAGSALNDTATGISIITQSANKRLELIARMFLEGGVIPMYRFLIGLNQRFIDEDTVVRLTNNTLQITPDDLTGEFDILVGGSLGINNKEQKMATNQQLDAIVTKLAQAGLAGPQEIYNTAKRELTELDIHNIDDYVRDPSKQPQMGGQNGAGLGGQTNGVISNNQPGLPGPGGQGVPNGVVSPPQSPITPTTMQPMQ